MICDEHRVLRDDCACRACDGCEETYNPDTSESCCPDRYCSTECADHSHCEVCTDIMQHGDAVCSDCYAGECCRSFRCEDCSRCEDCCACTASCIAPHSSRDYPDTLPHNLPQNACGIGVENEIETKHDVNTVAERIRGTFGSDEILMKEDGSLNNGFELVTGRLDLEHQRKLWSKLAPAALRAGARSWEHDTTGLHVHLSRAAFTPLSLAKFCAFINSDRHTNKIRTIAGRGSCHYSAIAKKKLSAYRYYNNDRYQAVNLTNRRTIEVRIFKGTLGTESILAKIEFCHALWAFTLQCSCEECEDWSAFARFVQRGDNRKEYARLIRFFSTRGGL